MTRRKNPTRLQARRPADLDDRLRRSRASLDGAGMATDDVVPWLAERGSGSTIAQVPLDSLDGWYVDPTTGDIQHHSGRFFTVTGLETVDGERHWQQPIILQPEVGVLAILACEIRGVLHFLLQAKVEPGNPNLAQLSPTVQATRSNFTGAHGGSPVRYLDEIFDPAGTVIADSLQSEHGTWFWHKRNRNLIVEIERPPAEHPDFCWLTLGQIGLLMGFDNAINMDTRTVLSGLPVSDPSAMALHSDGEVLSWLTDHRVIDQRVQRRMPLRDVRGWVNTGRDIRHLDGRHFRVEGLSCTTGSREVSGWQQPIFSPIGQGLIAFAQRDIEGQRHVLVQARREPGFRDVVEIAPTVQMVPQTHVQGSCSERARFADLLASAPTSAIRYDTVLAEEGGRLLNAVSRYMVVDVSETQVPNDPGEDFAWVTLGQLAALVKHAQNLNVQARTLLAAFQSGAVAHAEVGAGTSRDVPGRRHWLPTAS